MNSTNGAHHFTSLKSIYDRFDPNASIVLYCGDVNDFLTGIPDETIKLVVTSPPYNVGKEYETRVDIEKYLEVQKQIIAELYRVLRLDGSICWQVGNFVEDGEVFPLDVLYYPIFKSLGMRLRNRIIWRYQHGLHTTRRFSGRSESILWFTKTDDYTFNLDNVRVPSKYPGKRHYKGPNKGKPSGNPKGKNPSDVWEIVIDDWEEEFWDFPNVKAAHREKTNHPTQYPIELPERCVLALTNEDDWVFDPYTGVGSSLIAAIKHNRKAMGSEKEEVYVKTARERIQAYYNGTLRMREINTPPYKPRPNEKVAQIPEEWRQSSFDVNMGKK